MAPNMGAPVAHPKAISDPTENEGKGETAEGEQHRSEEQDEILRLLRGWQERETGFVVRWAWADDIGEERERQEEPEEESEEK